MKFISSILTEASGSVAGSCYSRNANGAYIRNKSVPTNRNTLAQQSARAKFTSVSSRWKTLTSIQQQQWADATADYPYVDKLGQTKTYTASQLFKALNSALAQTGLGQIDSPSVAIELITAISGAVDSNSSDAAIVIGGLFNSGGSNLVPTGYSLAIYATLPLGLGITAPKSAKFRLVTVLNSATNTVGLDITGEYQTIFGEDWSTYTTGEANIWYGFKFVAQNTGQSNKQMFQIKSPIVS